MQEQRQRPWTTREAADWLGVSCDYIRSAIDRGQLAAEVLPAGRRRTIRIQHDEFVAWLQAIGWKWLPRQR
jgi:excisionase family DNA binding protein